MLRRPASDLRRRFVSPFFWEVVHPFRRELNHELADASRPALVALRGVFDALTGALADWQAEGAALAGLARPPGPLRPGPEAVRAAVPGAATLSRLLAISWDFTSLLGD